MSPIDDIGEVEVPGKVPRAWGLGALVENSLIRWVIASFNAIRYGLSDLVRHAFDSFMEGIERPLLSMVGPIIDDALELPDLPDSVRGLLEKTRSGENQVGAILLAFAGVVAMAVIVPSLFSGLGTLIQYVSNKTFKTQRLGFDSWWRAKLQDPKYASDMERELGDLGWSARQIEAAQVISVTRPDVRDLLILWNRKEIDASQLGVRLRQIGVTSEAISEYMNLARQIPGPADLVRFALREAWRDDVVGQWGYDQGWVPEFGAAMDQQGFDQEWAKLYWRSHWMVPTVGQGFEMMWRGVIDDGELRDLLKINDLAPGWIDNVMKVARPVPGRIDRRYAYREGEIGEQDLFDLYKSDGYDDKWADILTKTTIGMAVSETKGLTRAAIEKAYRLRRLSFAEALAMMADIGVQAGIAEFYLEQADHDRADELLDLRIDAIEKQYKNQIIGENEARDQLGVLGLGGDEIDARLDVWRTAIRTSTKRPSKTDLASWFKQGIVGLEDYRDRMSLLDYPASDVDLYLSALTMERLEIAEEEERKARAEEERVRADRRRTDYQTDKARLSKDIAEVRAAIAGAQVALVTAQSERDRQLGQAVSIVDQVALESEYRPLFLEAEAATGAARVQIAELNTAIAAQRVTLQTIERSLSANVDVPEQTQLQSERLVLNTALARLQARIAGHKTEIARLQAEVVTTEDPDRIPVIAELILGLKVTIAELDQVQAEQEIRIEQIAEALLVVLSADRRAVLIDEREALDLEIRGDQASIAEFREVIREVELERSELEAELDLELAALPGRADQVTIRLKFEQQIAEIRRHIQVLQANVADLRIALASLAVEYREAGG